MGVISITQRSESLGNIRSAKKAAASRHNGSKGGRPRKKKKLVIA